MDDDGINIFNDAITRGSEIQVANNSRKCGSSDQLVVDVTAMCGSQHVFRAYYAASAEVAAVVSKGDLMSKKGKLKR